MVATLQSTKVSTKTETKTKADGSISNTTTTTITKKYSDGSTVTKVKVQTGTPPAASSRHNSATIAIKGNAYEFGYDVSKSTAPKAAVTTPKEFTQNCLYEHNRLRAMHNSPPLKLNHQLSKIAQGWANKLAKEGRMYRSAYDFGENLYCSTVDQPGGHAVKAWYDEIQAWDWNKMAGKGQTSHFTQLIWKRTKEIGVAAAYSKDGRLFVVVEYNPPGNFRRRYRENVDRKLMSYYAKG